MAPTRIDSIALPPFPAPALEVTTTDARDERFADARDERFADARDECFADAQQSERRNREDFFCRVLTKPLGSATAFGHGPPTTPLQHPCDTPHGVGTRLGNRRCSHVPITSQRNGNRANRRHPPPSKDSPGGNPRRSRPKKKKIGKGASMQRRAIIDSAAR